MTRTRCMFKLRSITISDGFKKTIGPCGVEKWVPCEQRTLEMSAVYGNGDPTHENTKFWQASPSGTFVISCVNVDAVAHMVIGKEYYIDITPAEAIS